MEWLKTEKLYFGLIFLDPPTFSNSKDREHDFDLQRDYIELIRLAARHLERNGILVFSNNFRRFKLDIEALAPLKIKNITAATIRRTLPAIREFTTAGKLPITEVR